MRHLHLKKEKKGKANNTSNRVFHQSSSSSIISFINNTNNIFIKDEDSSKSTIIIHPCIFHRRQIFAVRLAINHLLLLHLLFSLGLLSRLRREPLSESNASWQQRRP
jgi:hypothetical protein